MSPPPISFGILGFGRLAERVHAPVLRRLRDARLVAIAEFDPFRRAEAGKIAGRGSLHANVRELLENPAVDAVIVCLPPAQHLEAALAAREAGKHCYLEKPLATTPEEGERILDAWRDSSHTAQIGFNYRHHPLARGMRERIQRGELGEIVSVRSRFHSHTGNLQAWKKRRTDGGGVLLDLASHHFDLLPFLLGSPVHSVEARLSAVESEGDKATVHLHLANGVQAHSSFSWMDGNEDTVEVEGTKRTLVFDRQRGVALRTPEEPPLPPWPQRLRLACKDPFARTKLRHPHAEPSYAAALTAFIAAIRAGKQGSPSLEDGYRSLLVVAAAERAAASETAQRLGETPDLS